MRVVENRLLPPRGYKAVTLGNLIFVRKGTEVDGRMLRHEAIHWEQEKELLVVGFYVLYALEFVVRLVAKGFRWKEAYRSVSFEREAYGNQDDLRYLQERKRFAWWEYLKM